MKQLFTIAFIALIILQSCSKDKMSAANIAGNWIWIATSTDAAPGPQNPLTPQNSGMAQSLNFNGNS